LCLIFLPRHFKLKIYLPFGTRAIDRLMIKNANGTPIARAIKGNKSVNSSPVGASIAAIGVDVDSVKLIIVKTGIKNEISFFSSPDTLNYKKLSMIVTNKINKTTEPNIAIIRSAPSVFVNSKMIALNVIV